jgi:hypothetical protein
VGKELRRLSKRKQALQQIDRITDHPEDALVVHYSCESFYDRTDGRTPRVTSIAVRNLESAQTESYSIHKIAEQEGIDFTAITDHYDALEKRMLQEFFQFAIENQGKSWIHWNMRDINYGFQALEHRLKVLKGTPFVLPEGKKFDLARAMVAIYGNNYMPHHRMVNLVVKNNISKKDMLPGDEEAAAFVAKEYVKLHQSTLRKVDILAGIFERVADGSIETNAKWYETHGAHPKVLVELVTQHWITSLVGLVVTVGGLIGLAELF